MKAAWRWWPVLLGGAAAALLGVLWAADRAQVAESPVADSGRSSFAYDASEAGTVLATVPSAGEIEPAFEGLVDLSLSHDQQSFCVLDGMAAKVYHFDLDGGLLGEMGRRGQGPEEMEFPSALRPVPEGVWVLDPEAGRAILWGAAASVVKSWRLGDGGSGYLFTPVGEGLLIASASPLSPSGSSAGSSASSPSSGPFVYRWDGGTSVVGAAPGVDLELVPADDRQDRLFGLELAQTGPGEVFAARNSGRLQLWKLSFDAMTRQVTELSSVEVPSLAAEAIAAGVDPKLPPDVKYRPLTGVHVVGETIWVTTAGAGRDLLAFSVPQAEEDGVELVLPGDLYAKLLPDAIVLPDRIIAISEIEVLVVERVPTSLDLVVESEQ